MIKSVHFLLTYQCTYTCDHCFLYCSPEAEGTFTLKQLKAVFDEMARIDTVISAGFEGGEPTLFYPLLIEGIKLARSRGLKTGMVSNAYQSTSVEDAELWLRPLKEADLSMLELSDDLFHNEGGEASPAKLAHTAAKKLGLQVSTIAIKEPTVEKGSGKGRPVIGGGAMFKGRAVEKLTEGLPTRPWEEFTTCPYEELERPERVHVDCFGNVMPCQGISLGNMWETPLSEIDAAWDAQAHPICGPLIRGGPAQLAREHGVGLDGEFVDECHFCFVVRKALLDRFPHYLGPAQVYGIK